MVEDGTAFCRQCNAPQIRVMSASGAEPAMAGEVVASPSYAGAAPNAIQWSHAFPATALAGLIAALVMFTPLGVFGIGMLAAGALAAVFYQRRNPAAHLTPGMGARLGLVSGTLGFGIFAILTSIGMLVFRSGGQLRAALLQAIQQTAARNPDPQFQQTLDYLKSPSGLVLFMILALIATFFIFLILSSIGGALGALLLRRRARF